MGSSGLKVILDIIGMWLELITLYYLQELKAQNLWSRSNHSSLIRGKEAKHKNSFYIYEWLPDPGSTFYQHLLCCFHLI